MAVKRTKKQKQQAQVRRLEGPTYEFKQEETSVGTKKESETIDQKKIKQLMISSPKDIFKDLLKTVAVTFIVTLSLIGIYLVKR